MRFASSGAILENTFEIQKSKNKYCVPRIFPIVRLTDFLHDPEYIDGKIKEAYLEFHSVQDENDSLRKREIVSAINSTGQSIKKFSSLSRNLSNLIGDEWYRLRTESIRYPKFLEGELSEIETDHFEMNRFNLSLMFQYYTRIFELHDSLKFDVDKLKEVEGDIQRKIGEIEELCDKIKRKEVSEGELDLRL
jgi:hypothetical protein